MKEEITNGYIAGGIFVLVGILSIFIGFDQGASSGKITIIVGFFLSILGIGSLKYPNTIGHIVATYLKGLNETESQGKTYRTNAKIRARHSNYTGRAKTVNIITNNNYKSRYKRRRKKRK